MNMILNGKSEASAAPVPDLRHLRSSPDPAQGSLEHGGEGAAPGSGWLADLDSFGVIDGFDDLLASFMDDAGHFHSGQESYDWS